LDHVWVSSEVILVLVILQGLELILKKAGVQGAPGALGAPKILRCEKLVALERVNAPAFGLVSGLVDMVKLRRLP